MLVRLSGNAQPSPGDQIPVTWSSANMHYFDSTSEARVELTNTRLLELFAGVFSNNNTHYDVNNNANYEVC